MKQKTETLGAVDIWISFRSKKPEIYEISTSMQFIAICMILNRTSHSFILGTILSDISKQTRSNLTIEALEEAVKYMLKVNNQDTRERCHGVVLIFLLLTWNMFHAYVVSIVDFEQINVYWDMFRLKTLIDVLWIDTIWIFNVNLFINLWSLLKFILKSRCTLL